MFIKKKSNKLEIVYDISSGIPFRWEYEIKDNSVCEFVKVKSKGEKKRKPICGGNVQNTYIFRGLKSGKTKIIFKLINIADNNISEVDEYNIEVDDDNNTILLSKEHKRNI